jgi:ribosomal protein S27AE
MKKQKVFCPKCGGSGFWSNYFGKYLCEKCNKLFD